MNHTSITALIKRNNHGFLPAAITGRGIIFPFGAAGK